MNTISIAGTFDDGKPGNSPSAKLGVFGNAGYPNYAPADANGYPPAIAGALGLGEAQTL